MGSPPAIYGSVMKFQFLGLLGFIFSIGVATAQAREVYLNCDDDRGDEVMFAVTPDGRVHSGYIAYLPRDERHTGSIDRATLGQATAEMWQAVGQVAFTIYSGRPGSMFYDPNRTAVRFDEGLLTGAASAAKAFSSSDAMARILAPSAP